MRRRPAWLGPDPPRSIRESSSPLSRVEAAEHPTPASRRRWTGPSRRAQARVRLAPGAGLRARPRPPLLPLRGRAAGRLCGRGGGARRQRRGEGRGGGRGWTAGRGVERGGVEQEVTRLKRSSACSSTGVGGLRAVVNRGIGACRDWAAAYTNTAEEAEGYWLEVTGQLPQDLRGTLYRWDGARTQLQQPGPAQCSGF